MTIILYFTNWPLVKGHSMEYYIITTVKHTNWLVNSRARSDNPQDQTILHEII